MIASIRLDQPTVLESMLGLGDAADGTGAASDLDAPAPASAAPEPLVSASLPEGARLGEYEIIGLVGEGGFGIVYLAHDAVRERHIAIKEYLPSALAMRVGGSQAVVVKSERHAESFQVGLRSFVNEARLLERFDHPSLVKALGFWEANGTAYMAMPFYEGRTLAHVLETMGRAPDEAELRAWLAPLLNALGVLHAARCFHRDIAPDNILLTPDGPLLLDFGAARRVLNMADAPTVMFKPGYTPIEQYGEVPELKQGPWTDLYALASVVHAAVTGRPPPPANERWKHDTLAPLSEVAGGRYGPSFLAAIDAALALLPADRPASAAEFQALLDRPAAPRPEDTAAAAATGPAVDEPPEWARVPAPATAAPLPMSDPPSLGTIASPWERRRRWPWLLGLALLALAFGGWGLHALRSGGTPAPRASDAPVAARATAPQSGPAPSASPVPEVEPAPPVPVPPPPLPSAPAPALRSATKSPPVAAKSPAVAPVAPPRAAPDSASSATGAKAADVRKRCSEILQRASIEPLRFGEAAFLKRDCRS